MINKMCLATLLISAFLASSAHALTVTRTQQVLEETTIEDFFKSLARGAGVKLGESLSQMEASGLRDAVEELGIELESMSVKLLENSTERAAFELDVHQLTFTVVHPVVEFDLKKINWVSQSARFWATINGRRIHFQQELESLSAEGLVRIDIRVLNSIDRVTGAHFVGELYEARAGELTKFTSRLTVSARVPGCPRGLIHRRARGIIAGKSDQALVRLDTKVRDIVSNQGNFLELAKIVGERVLAGR